mgnify:CR=1 FL=1
MGVSFKLALKYLKKNKKRSIGAIVAITIATMLLISVVSVFSIYQNYMIEVARKTGRRGLITFHMRNYMVLRKIQI